MDYHLKKALQNMIRDYNNMGEFFPFFIEITTSLAKRKLLLKYRLKHSRCKKKEDKMVWLSLVIPSPSVSVPSPIVMTS